MKLLIEEYRCTSCMATLIIYAPFCRVHEHIVLVHYRDITEVSGRPHNPCNSSFKREFIL